MGLGVRVKDRVRVSIFKDLCDNNAHYKLVYNIGNKFDGDGCKVLQKLPTAARDGLSKPKELVGRLVIREATAEVVSRSAVAIQTAGDCWNRVQYPSR